MITMSPMNVYAVGGTCLFFKRKVFDEINGFDDVTFLGSEEYIVAEKLHKKHYQVFFDPRSVIYHKLGQSTKKADPVDKTIAFITSEKYLLKEYYKMPEYQIMTIMFIKAVGYLIMALFTRSYRKNFKILMRTLFR